MNAKYRQCSIRIGAIDMPRSNISPEFIMARYARASREQIDERKKRMHALKVLWRGNIPRDVLRDFD